MTSPADDLNAPREQPKREQTTPSAEELVRHELPTRDQKLVFTHRYLSGLCIRIRFELGEELGAQSIQVNRTSPSGVIDPFGFILCDIPLDLQRLLAPNTLTGISSSAYLTHILETVEKYNASTGAEPSIQFRPLDEKVPTDEEFTTGMGIRDKIFELAHEIHFQPPHPLATEFNGEIECTVYSSSQPLSIRAWARGNDHSTHTVHMYEKISKNAAPLLSLLHLEITITHQRSGSLYVRLSNSDGANFEFVDEQYNLRGIRLSEFLGDAMDLVQTAISRGSVSLQTHCNALIRNHDWAPQSTSQPQHRLTSGAIIELDKVEMESINILANPQTTIPSLIFYRKADRTDSYSPIDLERVFEQLKYMALDINSSRIANLVASFEDSGGRLIWNQAAPLPRVLEELHENIRDDRSLRLGWIQGVNVLPNENKQILELLDGRQAVRIVRETDLPHELGSMTIICRGNTVEEVFLRSRQELAIDFSDFRVMPPVMINQARFLAELVERFNQSPFAAMELLGDFANTIQSNAEIRFTQPFMKTLEHVSAFYRGSEEYSPLVSMPFFPDLFRGRPADLNDNISVTLRGNSRYAMKLQFYSGGLDRIDLYRSAFLNPLWISRVASFVLNSIDQPEAFYDQLVATFFEFTNAKSPLEDSELFALLTSPLAAYQRRDNARANANPDGESIR